MRLLTFNYFPVWEINSTPSLCCLRGASGWGRLWFYRSWSEESLPFNNHPQCHKAHYSAEQLQDSRCQNKLDEELWARITVPLSYVTNKETHGGNKRHMITLPSKEYNDLYRKSIQSIKMDSNIDPFRHKKDLTCPLGCTSVSSPCPKLSHLSLHVDKYTDSVWIFMHGPLHAEPKWNLNFRVQFKQENLI